MKLETGNWKIVILIALFALQVFGADVMMTVSPPIVSLGESAQVRVEVRDAKRPQAPAFPSVDGLNFSGTRQSSQTSIINGKVDKSTSYTTTVYPQRTGDFQIGPFNYKVDGETKQLSGTLRVVATSGDSTSAQSWSDLVFAKVIASSGRTYVQEPFELTLQIFSKPGLQIHSVENLRGLPETGLSKPEWKEAPATRQQINGEVYEVRQFKASLRAMGSGTFDFAPMVTVQVVAPQQQQQRRRDMFGFSMFNSVQTIPVDLTVEPASVRVLPLPVTGKPDGFSGAVGHFQFQVTAEPTDVSPGDPITLQMTIIGDGNYDRILPPTLPVDAPFRLFGDAVRQQGSNGVRFEQVISPRDATATEIPALDFSYFDSESGTYRTVSSSPIPITVDASSNNTAQLFAAQETMTVAPADTPFASESDIQRITGWLTKQWKRIRPWLWILPAALGIGFITFLGRKLYHWKRKDVAWVRQQQAPKAARKELQAAEKALKKNDAPAFYEALGAMLSAYFGNRMNLTAGNVTPTRIYTAMEEASIEPELIKNVQTLFEKIELQRYGMGGATLTKEEMKQLHTDCSRLLRSLEKTRF